MKKMLILLIITGFVSGCAQDFYTTYNTGTADLNIKLSAAMRNVNVTLNDSLVAEDKFTRNISISDIPAGTYNVRIIGTDSRRSGDINYRESVSLKPNSHKTLLIDSPPVSSGYWIYSGLIYLASFSVTYYIIY